MSYYVMFYYVIFQFTDTIGSFTKETVIIFMIVTYMIDAVYEFFFSGNIYSFNQKLQSYCWLHCLKRKRFFDYVKVN